MMEVSIVHSFMDSLKPSEQFLAEVGRLTGPAGVDYDRWLHLCLSEATRMLVCFRHVQRLPLFCDYALARIVCHAGNPKVGNHMCTRSALILELELYIGQLLKCRASLTIARQR